VAHLHYPQEISRFRQLDQLDGKKHFFPKIKHGFRMFPQSFRKTFLETNPVILWDFEGPIEIHTSYNWQVGHVDVGDSEPGAMRVPRANWRN
jgi:hypothetical protein